MTSKKRVNSPMQNLHLFGEENDDLRGGVDLAKLKKWSTQNYSDIMKTEKARQHIAINRMKEVVVANCKYFYHIMLFVISS
jgi:hypothetical protein